MARRWCESGRFVRDSIAAGVLAAGVAVGGSALGGSGGSDVTPLDASAPAPEFDPTRALVEALSEQAPETAVNQAPPGDESLSEARRASTPSQEALPLGPATRRTQSPSDDASQARSGGALDGGAGVARTVLALGAVIGLILVLRFGVKRVAGSAGGLLSQLGPGGRAPSGLVTILGRYPVGRGQTLVLLKLDSRVLLMCQTAEGFRTLSEVTAPEEVASILVKTRDEDGESLASRFRGMLSAVERSGTDGDESSRWPTSPRQAWMNAEGHEAVQPGSAVSALRRRLESLRGAES